MRCFLAVSLPADQAEALGRLDPPLGRAVPPENMHVTLAFLGDQDRAALEEIDRAMETVHVAVGEIRITGLTTFGREPHALVAEVAPEAGLAQLRSSILGRLHGAGIHPDRQRFRPHVTLARFNTALGMEDAQRLARFIERKSGLALDPFPVMSFALYQSTLHRDGARYDELARYPLPPAGS